MSVRLKIKIDNIKIGPRIRRPLSGRVQALAGDMEEYGLEQAIEVVENHDGYLLVKGGHRIAAAKLLKWESIDADVLDADEVQSRHELTLREIRENFMRFELNALERAVSLSRWKESYEAIHGTVKRGRKKASEQQDEEMSAKFALSFSEAAQREFRISRRSVFLSMKIAKIGEDVRDRIAEHTLAGNQSELLALAELKPDMQTKVCDLLLSEPPQASSVEDAVLQITKKPKSKKPAAWEKASEHFSKLSSADQNRFFELHAEAIEKWFAQRGR